MKRDERQAIPQMPAEVRRKARRGGHGAKSDAVRERAILALLSARTVKAAAKQCGLDEKTLRRWLKDDADFRHDLAAARQVSFEAGIGRVQSMTEHAVGTLEELLGAKGHPAVRLVAARTLIELATHQHEAEAILRRLENLEGAAALDPAWQR